MFVADNVRGYVSVCVCEQECLSRWWNLCMIIKTNDTLTQRYGNANERIKSKFIKQMQGTNDYDGNSLCK